MSVDTSVDGVDGVECVSRVSSQGSIREEHIVDKVSVSILAGCAPRSTPGLSATERNVFALRPSASSRHARTTVRRSPRYLS